MNNKKIAVFIFVIITCLGINLSKASYVVNNQEEIGYDTKEYESSSYSIESVPNPKEKGQDNFVSNPNNILSSYAVDQLNELAQNIEKVSKAEYAIVIVDDYIGDSDFDFALELFNKWGIGKKEANNGLLLFIAKDRREYRFISGYGMEGLFPDAYLKRVGEKYLVPNFRNDDYDQGVIEASTFIAQILNSPDSIKELERLMPEERSFWNIYNPVFRNTVLLLVLLILLYAYMHAITKRILRDQRKQPKLWAPIFQGCGCMGILMFLTVFIFVFIFNNLEEIYQVANIPYFILVLGVLILAMKITNGRSQIKENFKDTEELSQAYNNYLRWSLLPMLLTPLAWIDLGMINRTLRHNKEKLTPPDNSGNWMRINRATKAPIKGMLSQGQKNEERIGARRYEVWKNTQSDKIISVPWDINKRFKLCPQCNFYTLELNVTKTLRAATYSSTGEGEKYDHCHNCSYRVDKGRFTIPKKERSSSSSSSGGSSSGGGSSSSGSFGGGSSGGGGAGGRW